MKTFKLFLLLNDLLLFLYHEIIHFFVALMFHRIASALNCLADKLITTVALLGSRAANLQEILEAEWNV